ncbi:MAG: hypothetical protein ACXAB7_23095, partial [Candidatus Kariarchaeaceae archaeon]
YAVSYEGTFTVDDPRLFDVLLEHDTFTVQIPASVDPSFVSYHVVTYDTTGNMTTSPTFELLMDHTPEIISFNNMPSALGGDLTLDLNVTIRDDDNLTKYPITSVTAYYRLVGDETWGNSVALSFFNNTDDYEAFYTGTIPYQNLGLTDLNLEINVTATDSVGGRTGYTGFDTDSSITVDNLPPHVLPGDIFFDPRATGNLTHSEAEVFLRVIFTDPSGIQSANILYTFPGSSAVSVPMQNTTNLLPGDPDEEFNVTLPALGASGDVEYYFQVKDFLNNTGLTPLNQYLVDGDGPTIDQLVIYNEHKIANTTDVLVLYNVSDVNDVALSTLWYSYDGGLTWFSDTPSDIAGDITEPRVNFFDYEDFEDLTTDPVFLNNSDFSSFSKMRVNHTLPTHFRIADVTVVVGHESHTDLRMWIQLENGEEYLIFDRAPGSGILIVTVDLLKLGVDKSFFKDSNFTLLIQDFSDEYYGVLLDYEIELREYLLDYGGSVDEPIPFGFESYILIPAANNDTDVIFYVESYDFVFNVANSTQYSYYSDGAVPLVTLETVTSPLDVQGDLKVRFNATITDGKGGIQAADLYFRYSEDDPWTVREMQLDPDDEDQYYAYIDITGVSGEFSYYVRAMDNVNLITTSEIVTIGFDNGLGPMITVFEYPYDDPFDMNGTSAFRVYANITDNGEVVNAKIYYKFNVNDTWKDKGMKFDKLMGLWYADISVKSVDGIILFQIEATDDTELTNISETHMLNYANAKPSDDDSNILVIGLIGAGAVAIIGGGGYIIYTRRKKSLY